MMKTYEKERERDTKIQNLDGLQPFKSNYFDQVLVYKLNSFSK